MQCCTQCFKAVTGWGKAAVVTSSRDSELRLLHVTSLKEIGKWWTSTVDNPSGGTCLFSLVFSLELEAYVGSRLLEVSMRLHFLDFLKINLPQTTLHHLSSKPTLLMICYYSPFLSHHWHILCSKPLGYLWFSSLSPLTDNHSLTSVTSTSELPFHLSPPPLAQEAKNLISQFLSFTLPCSNAMIPILLRFLKSSDWFDFMTPPVSGVLEPALTFWSFQCERLHLGNGRMLQVMSCIIVLLVV